MVHPLGAFTVDDLVELSTAVRALGLGTSSMEQAAQRVVRYLRANLLDAQGRPACPLVRFYKTHRFADLEPELQNIAAASVAEALQPETRCLILLATAGEKPAWNDRHITAYDAALPLTPSTLAASKPNVAGLIEALGLDVDFVMRPTANEALQRYHREYRVLHVADTSADNPFSFHRAFIEALGIQSVLALGGVLPSGDMFALALFATVTIDERTAELLRSLSLSVKAAIVRHTFKVFAPSD